MVHVAGPGFGDWVSDLTQARLRQVFGAETSLRGWDYAFRDQVESIQVMGDLDRSLLGSVKDSEPRPFSTVVTVHRVPGGWSVTSSCSCPDGYLCKHAAAVIFTAQRAAATAGQSRFGALPTWEKVVQAVLRPADPVDNSRPGPDVRQHGDTPLALIFALTSTGVLVRPGGPGRSKPWVQGGFSVDKVRDAARVGGGFADGHAEAVLSVFQSVTDGAGARSWIEFSSLGGDVWRNLLRCQAYGVTLVTTGGEELRLRDEPATPRVILREMDDGRVGLVLGVDQPDAGVEASAAGTSAALVTRSDGPELRPLRRVSALNLGALVEDPPVIPADEVARFSAEYLPRLARHVAVETPSLTGEETLPATLVLDLTFGTSHVVEMVWSSVYRTSQGRETRYYLRTRLEAFGRDVGEEKSIEQRVLAVPGLEDFPQLTLRTQYSSALREEASLTGLPAAQFVEQILPAIDALDGVEVVRHGTAPDYRQAKEAPRVELAATDSDDADWFDLAVSVHVEDHEVPLPQLFSAIARGDEYIILDSGTYFGIDRPELRQLRELIEEAKTLRVGDSGQLRLSALQAGLWEELVDLGVVRQQSERWRRAAGALLNIHDRPAAPIPSGIDATLRPYQAEGFQWLTLLWDLNLGGILADDMGLGKTLQVLALAQHAKETGTLTHPLLVVAPTSVLGTWMSESRKFAPNLKVTLVNQSARRRTSPLRDVVDGADLVVTSYPLLRIDAQHYHDLPWRGMVLDEAQFVKNHQAKTYQVARKVEAPFKLAVTGTPLENSLMDLWSLLSIVAPGLYPNPDQFTENFRKPIEQDRNASRMATLRRRTRPLMLRRAKEEVARELPPKVEQTLIVTLNSAHRRTYEKHLNRERGMVLGLMGDIKRNRIEVLAALTRLRQLALAPVLVDEAYADVASSKIDVLMEHLTELSAEGHRALVFSQFTGFLGLIRKRLEAEGIQYEYLDGSTRDRTGRIDRFKDGAATVFLISLKAGGFGLNLTEAGYVYVMDPWWNPAAEEQAIDRTHRIGQDKTVMVYRMVSEGTIEEKVVALQERKRALFRDVVGDGAMSGGQLTPEDIRGLLNDD